MKHRWAKVRTKPGRMAGRYKGPPFVTHYCIYCGAELHSTKTHKYQLFPRHYFRCYNEPRAVVINKRPLCEGLPVGYEPSLG